MTEQDLETAAAKYVLGVLPSWELTRVADRALERGLYSFSLGELATMRQPVMADAGPLFESALHELGIDIPAPENAVWVLLRYHIGRIATGKVTPRAGLCAILKDVYYPAKLYAQRQRYGADVYDVATFHASYYFYDDLETRSTEVSFNGLYGEDAIKAFDQAVVKSAEEWRSRHGA